MPSDIYGIAEQEFHDSLNPCSNGIPSDRTSFDPLKVQDVLIPVLMEYPLTETISLRWTAGSCLNPCSNGIPSDTVVSSTDLYEKES